MQQYYGWIFTNDPWFADRLREAKAIYADLEQALRKEMEGVGPADLSMDKKFAVITKHLVEKYRDALVELGKGPEG